MIWMKLLVTGGLGFIGSNFIRLVLSEHEDCRVVNLDACRYGSNMENLRDLDGTERYSLVNGDISDQGRVSRLVRGVDAVLNFAAETHVDRSISSPGAFLQSNVMGVFSILEALRRENRDARFVHVSTDEVYGDISQGSFSENSALRPSSPYSASKAAGDVFVQAYARTYGLPAMVTRCTNNYGPYQFPEKLIPKTIIRAVQSLKVPIYGTGQNIRDWIYVEDHCRAVERVLEQGAPGEVYNISAGHELTNLEVVRSVLEMLGRDEDLIEFVEDRPGHDVRYSLDSSRIRERLGWRPERSFSEGLKSTVRWYLQNEGWWRRIVDERILHPTPWKLEW